MQQLQQKINSIDWNLAQANLHENGYTIIPDLISENNCRQLIAGYENSSLYRKTVTMERYRFGKGEYKYFNYPLPAPVQFIRESIYPKLVSVANSWMKVLGIEITYPESHDEFIKKCGQNEQHKATALILKYGVGGFNTLHQDLYGDVFFPLQLVLFLNDTDNDYSGGEFVLTEQIPRAQSKAIVLKPKRGDALIFTTNFRPVKGSRGYYRVNMKHGISEVKSGQRFSLGIIFHDALS